MQTILLIDDDRDFLELAESVLKDAGYDTYVADCPKTAFPMLLNLHEELDLIVCDLHMSFSNGIDHEKYVNSFETGIRTIRELQIALPDTAIMALSAAPQMDLNRLAGLVYPTPVLTKPLKPSELVDTIKSSLAGEMKEQLSNFC